MPPLGGGAPVVRRPRVKRDGDWVGDRSATGGIRRTSFLHFDPVSHQARQRRERLGVVSLGRKGTWRNLCENAGGGALRSAPPRGRSDEDLVIDESRDPGTQLEIRGGGYERQGLRPQSLRSTCSSSPTSISSSATSSCPASPGSSSWRRFERSGPRFRSFSSPVPAPTRP